jgi:GTP-binding protein YchF
MRVALVGLPQAGKTTIYGALTRQPVRTGAAGYGLGQSVAVVEVPDRRVDALAEIYRPRKVTRAAVEFTDGGPGAEPGRADAALLQLARVSDLLVHVVRAFENDAVARETPLSPLGDLRELDTELILADLALAENRLERLQKQSRGRPSGTTTGMEQETLLRIREHLESELPVQALELTPPERESVRHLDFLSDKPAVVVPNIGEADLPEGRASELDDLRAWTARSGVPVVPICGAVELEVAQLTPGEEAEFLNAMGVAESGRTRLLRTVYELLGLISFFTVGDDEVKAWTIRRGDSALTAAGKIHSDLARGFIRAEVIPCAALEAAGDPRVARERSLFRLEQRNYTVVDGDVLNIRFSV